MGKLPAKMDRRRKERAPTGDIPILSAAISAPAPPPGFSRGVSLDSSGMSRSYISNTDRPRALLAIKCSQGSGVAKAVSDRMPSSTKKRETSPFLGSPDPSLTAPFTFTVSPGRTRSGISRDTESFFSDRSTGIGRVPRALWLLQVSPSLTGLMTHAET